jgi:undecaprenyl diphosphate synthase
MSNPLHIGIIMDGNGRWAAARGKQRIFGHRRGAQSVREVVEAAPDLGIKILTLYAFSSDNWQRPPREVTGLMSLLHRYLRSETAACVRNGVRISFVGRRDRLNARLRDAISATEAETSGGETLHLRLAVDYSSRDAILRAVGFINLPEKLTREQFAEAIGRACGGDSPAPDVDLLIRTGGEQRLSDFLLWECAYAELFFTDIMWPDFGKQELAAAMNWFHGRERRFGRIPIAVAS